MKKGGLKKVAIEQLAAQYVCVGYGCTSSMLEYFGKKHDELLLSWKNEVEHWSRREREVECQLQQIHADEDLTNNHTTPDTVLQYSALEEELKQVRQQMHPGYSFTGDNVDIRHHVRQITQSNQNKDHHLYHLVAYKNRVAGHHLPDDKPQANPLAVPLKQFLPSEEDQSTLIEEMALLVTWTWSKYIPSIADYGIHVDQTMHHENMESMKKKTEKVYLGVLDKNEQYGDDMIDIVEYLHAYVPGHSVDTDEQPVKILSGGDYLTFERHKEAQSSKRDGRTPSSRVEGLIPKVEDFHVQAEWQKVIWLHLYSTASCRDIGTLHAARNAINSRNVSSDPAKNFYASSELLDKFTDAYLVAGL
ncbi:uncharacterized protein [Ptychodera flava]|uniref:uncharacterized protein n=1 Tax=Ptychodera flava TaxID=63121 RepID=UPI00396A3D1A